MHFPKTNHGYFLFTMAELFNNSEQCYSRVKSLLRH